MNKIYTGIGSRDVTEEEFSMMTHLAVTLGDVGFTLRSGGAKGADTAFELGCAESVGGLAEIYIPWKGFGKKILNPNSKRFVPSESRFEDAKKYLLENEIIPWFERMSQGAQKLHARDYYQCVGMGVVSDFMIYCAEDDKNGVPKGGTRTAILLARSLGVPTYNIRNEIQCDQIYDYVYKLKCGDIKL